MSYIAQTLTNSFPQAILNNLKVQFYSITEINDKLTCSRKVLKFANEDERDSLCLALGVIDINVDKKLRWTTLINMRSK